MKLRPRPFWLNWIISDPHMWVTLGQTIYHPKDLDPQAFPSVIAHESVHVRQQAEIGRWVWLWRYCTNPAFRLDQEAQAIAVELQNTPEWRWESTFEWYTQALAGKTYHQAANSPLQATLAIQRYLAQVSR